MVLKDAFSKIGNYYHNSKATFKKEKQFTHFLFIHSFFLTKFIHSSKLYKIKKAS
jgi:hypothetical protein